MIGIIVQARTKSVRFPRKIYEDICGHNTLQWTLRGVADSKMASRIILAMPNYDEAEFNDRYNKGELSNYIDGRFGTYFGHEDDLMERYYQAATKYDINVIVRVCADSPLISGSLIDEMLRYYVDNKITGFLGNLNICKKSYPAGMCIEIFSTDLLVDAMSKTNKPIDREHVTKFMYREGTDYAVHRFENSPPNTEVSTRFANFSFDTEDDLILIKKIVAEYNKSLDLNKAILSV